MTENKEQSSIISQVECFKQDFNLASDHYISLVRSPRIDTISKHKSKQQTHSVVSRSLKAFFQKLRGATNQETVPATVLASPVSSTEDSSYSKPAVISQPSKRRKQVTLLKQPPSSNKKPFRVKAYRHTLDLSTTFLEQDDFVLRRANSLGTKESRRSNSMDSIYSSFTSSASSSSSSDHQGDQENTVQSEYTLQESLWNQDDTVCTKEETAQWLGTNDPTHARVLILYMQNFNFQGQRLDEAFRTLCSKLYFKAESQQLDRIVESFAKRYFECNPTTILQCVDVVYAIAYSLLLLNTDFYVQKWANKMTRQSFVKNTMATIYSLVFPTFERRESTSSTSSVPSSPVDSISPSILGSIKSDIESPLSTSSSSGGTGVMHVLRSNMSWKHSTGEHTLTKSQRHWLTDIENLLKDIYTTVKAHRIDQAQITEPNENQLIKRSRTLPKDDQEAQRRRMIRRSRGQSVLNTIPGSGGLLLDTLASRRKSVEFSQLPPPPTMSEESPAFYKHGLVMRKHVLESNDKRARHRQWQLCYLVMNKTELIMYRPMQQEQLQPTNGKTRRRRSMMLWNPSVYSSFSLQDIVKQNSNIDWQADLDAPPLTRINMNHAYASAIKAPGWNGQRPHVFRLETGEGGHWLFEGTDMFAVQAWVEAANATAAKISKGPLPGAVSNIDYGWGAKWDVCHPTEVDVPIWYPATPCMISSHLDVAEQYQDVLDQMETASRELDSHRVLKLDQDKKYSINSMQALINWDKKLQFLLQRLVKLRAYKEILATL